MRRTRGVLVGVVVAGALGFSGCVRPWQASRSLPGLHELVREQLVVHSDFPVPARHRLVEELAARRYDICRRLDLPPSDEPIHVYVFDDAERFEWFFRLHYPQLPLRRAFFFETDTRLEVYAYWGDRVADDLRHEVTHGYLHSVVPHVPLWLDEGLAEYFEVPRGHRGLNPAHLKLLAHRLSDGTWQPDLARLESLPADHWMTQDEYAEAWAWVHFLLETWPENEGLLRTYLHAVRDRGTAEPLADQLRRALGRPEAALVDHIRQMLAAAGSM